MRRSCNKVFTEEVFLQNMKFLQHSAQNKTDFHDNQVCGKKLLQVMTEGSYIHNFV